MSAASPMGKATAQRRRPFPQAQTCAKALGAPYAFLTPIQIKEAIMKMSRPVALAFAIAVPTAAVAQSSDASYCAALTQKYQQYVGQSETRRGARNPDATVNNAIEQCRSGNTASAIPILEKALQDAKVELPPRT
jgi:hypothetical protein